MQLNKPTTNLSEIAKYLQETHTEMLIDINNQPFILRPATEEDLNPIRPPFASLIGWFGRIGVKRQRRNKYAV